MFKFGTPCCCGSTCRTLWKFDTSGALIYEYDHGANLKSLAVASDDSYFIAGLAAANISIRAFAANDDPVWLSAGHGTIDGIAISAAYLYSIGGAVPRKLRQFGIATGTETVSGNWPVINTGSVVACDPSGNVLVGNVGNLKKYDSSGAELWSVAAYDGTSYTISGIATDSAGNVFVTGLYTGSGSTSNNIKKFNSSGTLQWQIVAFDGTFTASSVDCVTVDSAGAVYISFMANGAAGREIAQYDNSTHAQNWVAAHGPSDTNIFRSLAVSSSGLIGAGGDRSARTEGGALAHNTVNELLADQSLSWIYDTVGAILSVGFDSSENLMCVGTRDCT